MIFVHQADFQAYVWNLEAFVPQKEMNEAMEDVDLAFNSKPTISNASNSTRIIFNNSVFGDMIELVQISNVQCYFTKQSLLVPIQVHSFDIFAILCSFNSIHESFFK